MVELSAKTQQLVTLLIDSDVFSTTALDHILEQYAVIGGRFADFLLDSKLLGEGELLRLYANAGYGLANLEMLEAIAPNVKQQLSANLAYLHKAIPFAENGKQLDVAFLEPPEAATLQTMKGFAGREVRVFLAAREVLGWAIAKHYPELLQTPANKDTLLDPLEDRIGHRLIRSGRLTKAQLNEALLERTPGKAGRTGEVLLRMGYVSEEDVYRTLAEQLQVPFVQLPKTYEIPKEVALLFSKAEAYKYQCVPFSANELEIGMLTCEPPFVEAVELLFERRIVWNVTTPGDLKHLIWGLENNFDPLCNLLLGQGLLRLEQRAQCHLRVRGGERLEDVLFHLGIAESDLQKAQQSLPSEQVIPLIRSWEGMIDLSQPLDELQNATEPVQYADLDSMVRRIVREELEHFRVALLRE